VRKEYAFVLGAMRRAGLPEVLAALPYTESRYRPDRQSYACAKGSFQFMPEMAHRLESVNKIPFQVRDCQVRRPDGSTVSWTPSALAPPPSRAKSFYMDQSAPRRSTDPEVCLIPVQGGCRRDDRTDLALSTQAAVVALLEAWSDDEIARSGGAVPLTVLSHNAGYLDERFGTVKSWNVLPALNAWKADKPASLHHTFYGANILCPDKSSENFCRSKLAPETQHYGYTIIAQHMVAACYYGKNHRDAFEEYRSWDRLLKGYCERFAIPTARQVTQF
jgi:hypothetical protein